MPYDDGSGQYTTPFLDILNKAGAKTTFFWTGTIYDCVYNNRAVIMAAFDAGY